MEESNIRRNGRDYLKAARERLKSARLLLDAGIFPDSISRSYYAFLDAATACLITKNLYPRSHMGLIDLFSLHFIKTGKIDVEYIRYFKKIKKYREDADYSHKMVFTRKDAEEVFRKAEEFVNLVKKIFPKLLKEAGDKEKIEDTEILRTPGPEDEEREMEEKLAWFGKFSVEKRLRIGYQHGLAALRFMKLRPRK